MIRWLLGQTQMGTTQSYAHLIDSPLRAGVNVVGDVEATDTGDDGESLGLHPQFWMDVSPTCSF